MADSEIPTPATSTQPAVENHRIFRADILSQYQKSSSRKTEGSRQLQATGDCSQCRGPYSSTSDTSRKGILPLTALRGETLKPGDKALVTVKRPRPRRLLRTLHVQSRASHGLDRARKKPSPTSRPSSAPSPPWVKGGFSVDVGGARLHAPRHAVGVRDAGRHGKSSSARKIRCRIIKLDVTDEDVVVDRPRRRRRRRAERQGSSVFADERRRHGPAAPCAASPTTALSLLWEAISAASTPCCTSATSRGPASTSPRDVLSVGQQLEVKVLKLGQRRRQAPAFPSA